MRIRSAIPCLLFVAALTSGFCHATSRGDGRLSLQGAIIDAACAIDTGSREQSIDMGTLPLAQLLRDGQGKGTSLVIRLVSCILSRADTAQPDWKTFRITFEGLSDGGLFGLQGDAAGVALRITDAQGHMATPGVPLPPGNISPGEMQLDYVITPVANQQALKAGAYFATLRFRLDYF